MDPGNGSPLRGARDQAGLSIAQSANEPKIFLLWLSFSFHVRTHRGAFEHYNLKSISFEVRTYYNHIVNHKHACVASKQYRSLNTSKARRDQIKPPSHNDITQKSSPFREHPHASLVSARNSTVIATCQLLHENHDKTTCRLQN